MMKVRKMTRRLKQTSLRQGCEGCSVENKCYEKGDTGNLRVYYRNRIGKCPCKTCLVKMICDDICQDYRTAWNIEGLNIRMERDGM